MSGVSLFVHTLRVKGILRRSFSFPPQQTPKPAFFRFQLLLGPPFDPISSNRIAETSPPSSPGVVIFYAFFLRKISKLPEMPKEAFLFFVLSHRSKKDALRKLEEILSRMKRNPPEVEKNLFSPFMFSSFSGEESDAFFSQKRVGQSRPFFWHS